MGQIKKILSGFCSLILSVLTAVSLLPMTLPAQEQAETDAEPSGIVIEFNEEDDVAALIEQYKDLDNQDVQLTLSGAPAVMYQFLEAFTFKSLSLILPDDRVSFRYDDYKMADVKGLVSLTCEDCFNSSFSREDVYPELQELTLHYFTNSCWIFGETPGRLLPSLKHLTLNFDTADFFNDVMTYQDLYQLPGTIETVDVLVEGRLLTPEEIGSELFEEEASAIFLGMLLQCCPKAQINGTALTELPVFREKTVSMDLIRKAVAYSYIIKMHQKMQNGSMDYEPYSSASVYGKILFAEVDEIYGISRTSLPEPVDPENPDDTENTEEYRDGMVPEEMRAAGLEDADILVLIYEENYSVGFYTTGGGAYQTDTMAVLIDLNSETFYSPYTAASDDPPSSITVQTINGVPIGGSGYGDYEPAKAVEWVISLYDSSIPGRSERGSETEAEQAFGGAGNDFVLDPVTEDIIAELVTEPVSEPEPAPVSNADADTDTDAAPQPTPASEPEPAPVPNADAEIDTDTDTDAASQPTPASEPEPASADKLSEEEFQQRLLDALNDPGYDSTLAALQGGEVISQGTVSNTAAGLQQTLVNFGCNIAIDGSAGPGTFGALNQVLAAFGKEPAEKVDAVLYTQLLSLLLMSQDNYGDYEELMEGRLIKEAGTGEYQYLQGTGHFAAQRYYRAMESFQDSGYGDYEARMAACEQPWPSNGELWHNSSMYSWDMGLTFTVNSYDETEGMCFEVYTEDGTLASVLFLTGSGSVSTTLPGGNYRIKDGTGHAWYGMKDAFGRYGSYEFMSFNEFDYDEYLTWLGSGYDWTITINVAPGEGSGSDVDGVYSDWENWVTN